MGEALVEALLLLAFRAEIFHHTLDQLFRLAQLLGDKFDVHGGLLRVAAAVAVHALVWPRFDVDAAQIAALRASQRAIYEGTRWPRDGETSSYSLPQKPLLGRFCKSLKRKECPCRLNSQHQVSLYLVRCI